MEIMKNPQRLLASRIMEPMMNKKEDGSSIRLKRSCMTSEGESSPSSKRLWLSSKHWIAGEGTSQMASESMLSHHILKSYKTRQVGQGVTKRALLERLQAAETLPTPLLQRISSPPPDRSEQEMKSTSCSATSLGMKEVQRMISRKSDQEKDK